MELPEYFWADRLTPVRFYGYPSHTRRDIFMTGMTNPEYVTRFHDLMRKCTLMCVNMADEGEEPVWQKDVWDNHIVIECKTVIGETIYVGFSNNTFSIGRGVSGRKPRSYKEIVSPEDLSDS